MYGAGRGKGSDVLSGMQVGSVRSRRGLLGRELTLAGCEGAPEDAQKRERKGFDTSRPVSTEPWRNR